MRNQWHDLSNEMFVNNVLDKGTGLKIHKLNQLG
jgi:hypothetical protein